jgi:hypothetical protein
LPMKRYWIALGAWLRASTFVGHAAATDYGAALNVAVLAKEHARDAQTPELWQVTYDLFLKADAINHGAETQYELGVAAVQLSEIRKAILHYREALKLGLSGPAQVKAEAYLQEKEADISGTNPAGPATPVEPGSQQEAPPPLAASESEVFRKLPRLQLTSNALEGPARHDLKPHPSNAGAALLGAGVALTLTSGAFVAVSYARLTKLRTQMAELCEVPLGNSPDGCTQAEPGAYEQATSVSRSIARYRTVNAIAWSGVGAGLLLDVIGYWLWRNSAVSSASSPDTSTRLSVSQQEVSVHYCRNF